jgi:hypothetical protein
LPIKFGLLRSLLFCGVFILCYYFRAMRWRVLAGGWHVTARNLQERDHVTGRALCIYLTADDRPPTANDLHNDLRFSAVIGRTVGGRKTHIVTNNLFYNRKIMIIIINECHGNDIEAVLTRLDKGGWKTHVSRGEERTIIGVIGDERKLDQGALTRMDGVDRVVPVLRPFKLASRDFQPEDSKISVNGHVFGGNKVIIMAGPCAVESLEQMRETALAVKAAGAHLLRGGAFKPRTSPYSFQGLGEEGLKIMAQVWKKPACTITEVMAPISWFVARYTMLQIGRATKNYAY